LKKYLGEVEKFNGLCNRFIWLLVGQSKFIPNPRPISGEFLAPLIDEIEVSARFARKARELTRNADAEAIWAGIYKSLRQEKPGVVGAITRRAAPIVMRLATIYALLERSNNIKAPHLKAAIAVWDYTEKSAHIIFGDSLGNKKADKLRLHLAAKGRLTFTEIHDIFHHNESADEIQRVVQIIVDAGLGKVIELANSNKPTRVLVTNNEFNELNESTDAEAVSELPDAGKETRSEA
jgi:DNA replicative helicase MCM subunit Mcm2 (Cdc46/Mcm family)